MSKALDGALWISGPEYDYGPDDASYYQDHPNHVVTTTFDAEKPQGAVLEVAVCGLAVVRLNGVALEGGVPLGDWTNYAQAVYVRSYEVGDLLVTGKNAVEVELGNGFYNPAPLTMFGKYNLRERLAEVGTPQVLLAITQGDATLVRTDATWGCREGSRLFNNPYLGERVDLRVARGRELSLVARAGHRHLEPSPVPPCRVAGREEAALVRETERGLLVDVGKVVAGFADLTLRARAGQVVTVTYAELLREDCTINCESNLAGLVGAETPSGVCPGGPGAPDRALERDVIVCAEGENRFTSRFSTHSFRYALVEGVAREDLLGFSAVYVHTDLSQAGSLSTGNASFDLLLDAARRTKLNNVHGVWEDCARERLGYGGDMVALAHSNAMMFDVSGLIDKTVADFRRDQTARGGLPETVPFMGIGSNGPAYGEGPLLWQLAYPYLTVRTDQYYGRRDVLEREWPHLLDYARYLMSFDPAELATHCLGDHGAPGTAADFKSGTPDKDLVGHCAILWSLECVAEVARRLCDGRGARPVVARDDAEEVERYAAGLRTQVEGRFRNDDGSYGEGSQTACAFAAGLHLAGEGDAAACLAKLVGQEGYLSCGIFGSSHAYGVLHRTGRDDVMERWLMREEDPSLLGMLASGSGVLAEQFHEFLSSYDHAMFSSYAQWLYQALGGITVADDAVAADHLVIDPYLSRATDAVSCSYATPRGEARVSWRRTGDEVGLTATVPAGTRAEVALGGERRSVDAADAAQTVTLRMSC